MRQKIPIYKISGNKTVLTGLQGKPIYLKLIEAISRQPAPQPLFLDFFGVTATGSFMREAVLKLRDYCISGQFNLYPVVANPNEDTLEELKNVLELLPDAIAVCSIDKKGKVTDAYLVGILEEKQQIAFEAVLKEKEVDAATLAGKYKEDKPIGVTGWNNRLASLVAKGLVMETRKGRGKFYLPVLELQ